MDMSSDFLISEVSRVLSGDEALALREPVPGRVKATPNFARARDQADEDNVLHKPCAKPILVEVPRF